MRTLLFRRLHLCLWFGVCILLSACPSPQSSTRSLGGQAAARAGSGVRVALIIGNGAYKSAPHLRNPPKDARAMNDRLRELGFDTQLTIDATKQELERALHEFVRKLGRADLALLYYAGHGLQVGGHNYFVPLDARLQTEADVPYEAVDVQRVLESMQTEAKVGIILLDSCRDNPLANRMTRSLRGGGSRGLVRMEADGGELLIVYATSPERTAEDGQGEHSPFTTALLRHIGEKGVEVQSMLKHVIRDVEALTAGSQIPWQSSSLRSDIYLGDAASAAAAPVAVAAVAPSLVRAPEAPFARASESPPQAPPPASFTAQQPGFAIVPVNTPRLHPEAVNAPQLRTIIGDGPNELWAGGASGYLLHFDGSAWTEQLLPDDAGVSRIIRSGPADLSILASSGLFHGNSKRWTLVHNSAAQDITNGLWGTGARDLWLVGGEIQHWDGKRMTRHALKDILAADSSDMWKVAMLNDVFGSGPADIWATGNHGYVLHYDGKRWSKVNSGLEPFDESNAVWASGPRDVWVGGRGNDNKGFLWHYDGNRWSQSAPAALGEVKAISGTGPADVWVLADQIRRFDGKDWSVIAKDPKLRLFGLWARGPGDVWAVGEGVVLHYQAAAGAP